ncbi:MAG: hypothetical protein PHY46_00220 [Candidatus Omnitrophica bacterium]|nr:hypothetical protein [Candidatus Omnitrophota bacterium]MDD5355984.1 hypothetical protein [Candidatus Omnitrophota bacterium]
MAQANLAKELVIEVADKQGIFADIASAVGDAGVNITAVCAYAVSDKAYFRIMASDNKRAKDALVKKGFKVEEKDVVTVMLEDRVGRAKELALQLKEGKVNLYCLYGTTCGCAGSQALIVMGSNDCKKVINAING